MYYFLHISKCAGSSFVAVAARNVSLFRPHVNGNPLNPLTARHLKFWLWPAEEQRHFLSSDQWEMIANETAMGREAEFYEDVTYVTILRDPIDRLFSTYQFNIERAGNRLALEERGRRFAAYLQQRKSTGWRRNYHVTTLTYRDRESSRARLELAKRRLAQFDFIFFVETFAEDLKALASNGWTALDPPILKASGRTDSRWSAAREALADYPDLLRELLQENEQDLELYAFATGLAQERRAAPPGRLRMKMPAERKRPASDNFDFLSACAYEAFLKKDRGACEAILDRLIHLPESSETVTGVLNFTDFALARFEAPEAVEADYRAHIRERWTARFPDAAHK